jgi:2-C-methyl-D-erythritol 4-phosphate cytidylyltransferase/2-C-methyl-D-erythritol 2,4-cyclodiphosphate synthase
MLVDVVLVAAGSGTRMGGTDKSLITVAGVPLLRWSLDALQAHPSVRRVVLVTAADRVAAYGSLSWLPSNVTQILPGGDTRSASVLAGLTALCDAPGERAAIIAVHDAARPGLSGELLDRLFAACGSDASAPVLPLSDSITQVHGEGSSRVSAGSVPRESVAAVQTPQCFAGQHLDRMISEMRARLEGADVPTDETSVLERIGVPVHLTDGDPRLRKLTDPSDLPVIETLLASHASSVGGRLAVVAKALGERANLSSLRAGFGDDVHPVGSAGELRLGGLHFPGSPALTGHSDGDVVLHATADALLGAANLGDLGRLFPATDATPRGVDSGELLREVVQRTAAAGLTPHWLELTITARSPRLADRLPEMGERVAALIGLPATAVSVKASTGNLIGDEGAGRAVRCTALLLAEQRGA